jgi:Acyl-CoA carboxylase epsilon subunit
MHNAHSGAAPAAPPGPGAVPVMSIAAGNPSPQEIAALVAVLAARARPACEPAVPSASRSEWSARSALLRISVRAGPGAWRASALPR